MKRGREEEEEEEDEFEELDGADIWEFHNACEYGDTATVLDYIARGINVDAEDEDENTGLSKAAYYGQLDIVKLLISECADVNAVNKENETPLHEAIEHVDVAKQQ